MITVKDAESIDSSLLNLVANKRIQDYSIELVPDDDRIDLFIQLIVAANFIQLDFKIVDDRLPDHNASESER